MAVQQRAARASRTQVAVRSAAAFGAVLGTMAVWWPAGIAVAIVVCGVATVLANRMLQADRGDTVETELSALFEPFAPDEPLLA
ncbi:hypothetical protein [Amnibacterium sp.]|uniref:hypothetical protein n=1 Tax=Amnibacterium sp. TaxID=1872496 RepID=UPI002602171C|nr:hypothetical protein [Amnibacterium sp.]MCU1474637.1 hypothetical protein [Amnibacterium sp.]